MNDKQLLELAAKAAGLVTYGDYDDNMWAHPADQHPDTACHWNPLTDDGDALRLAVMLEMQVCIGVRRIDAVIVGDEDGQVFRGTEAKAGDIFAATRRAIVRAAAEIGALAHPDNKDGGTNG